MSVFQRLQCASLLNPPSHPNPVSSSSQGVWQKASWKIDEAMGRMGHASVIVDKYLVIIGGLRPRNPQTPANLVVFEMQKETCTEVEISGREPRPLYDHSACYWKDNQIIVYGGQGNSGKALSDVGIITLSCIETSLKAEWRIIETDSSIGRILHTAHIYNNQMIVLGGVGENGNNMVGIHILHLDNFKWEQPKVSGKPPQRGLSLHTSVLCGNEIYVFGRAEDDKISTFWCLNLEIKASQKYIWKKLGMESKALPCKFAAIQEHRGKIYLVTNVGASRSQLPMTLKSFEISQEKWSSDLQSKDQDPLDRNNFSLNFYDNQLIMYGGSGPSGSSSSDELWLFRLDDSAEIQKDSIKKQPKDSLTQHLKEFLTEAPYSDVIFEIESEQIPAHKWWLCKKSKYFANMFSSGMIETKSSKIVISDMNAATFRAFLEYLYSDNVELNVTLAKDLLTQADKFSVPELKGLCEQFLVGNISADNYVLLAHLSELLEANKLRDAVKDYIAKSIKVLKPRKDFEEISMDMLRDVLVKVTVR